MQNADLTEKTLNIIKHAQLFSYTKMSKEILTFSNIEIEKRINFTELRLFKRCRYWESVII